MAEKVVAFNGGEVLSAGIPRPDVIDELEKLLEAARAGQVQAVVFAALEADGLSRWNMAGLLGGSHALVGATYQALACISEITAKS